MVHSALPPVGKQPASAPSRPVDHCMAGVDESTYLEVMEADILSAQARIERMRPSQAIPPSPAAATRHYSSRDLSDERSSLGVIHAKLHLHHVLNEKLKHLERLTLCEAAARGGGDASPEPPSLSRLPSLLALLDTIDTMPLDTMPLDSLGQTEGSLAYGHTSEGGATPEYADASAAEELVDLRPQ